MTAGERAAWLKKRKGNTTNEWAVESIIIINNKKISARLLSVRPSVGGRTMFPRYNSASAAADRHPHRRTPARFTEEIFKIHT